MSTEPSSSPNDPNLSGLGRALLDTGGSKPSTGPWVPPTAEELHAILPQYEIVKMLGRGGMGAVYMGRQTALDRPVAIKILSAQLEESDMGFTERFKNEARAMGKLNHPAVVAVYEFGQHEGGLLYIVMEYVDGTDVARMIAKSGRLHTEHAMAITAHVCDALSYAHERGIIHRDIKPANIMVGYDGAVKVADFGLAKVSVGGQTLGLTQSGMAMGTMHYMAPEALMLGTSVDHRADIYAVGVMLYQMLTGKLPQGMFKLPSLLVPGLDPRYDAIVRKALMEDREVRYQNIRDMRAELDSILTQPVMKVEPAASAADAKAAALPTGARPQRPGGKPVIRPAAAPSIPTQTKRGSLAWLWMTTLTLGVLGGAAWMILPRNNLDLAPSRDVSATSEAPRPPQNVIATTSSVPKTSEEITAPQVLLKNLPATASVSTGTPSEPGWTSLFNGKDLTGWELHPSNFPADVQDGSIRIRGSRSRLESGHISYRGSGSLRPQWTDFELICTAKTENKGNSGVNIHSSPANDGTNIANGLEVDVWNDTKPSKSGSLYRFGAKPDSSITDGEWFQLKTRVVGKRIQTWLKKPEENEWGLAVDWTQPENWEPPAGSPGLKLGSGTISLQNSPPLEGVVWFKEVKFRSLDPMPDAPAVNTPAPSATPASFVETFNGHRYQFVPGALTWKEAKAKAESMGGHLATLTSKEENEWLLLTYRKLLTTPNRNIWLGAMEEMAGLGWKWVTGEPFTALGWFPGEPNGMRGGGGQVGHPFMLNLYSFKDGAVGWNDSSTHFSQSQANIGFIVEWDSASPATTAPMHDASATTWIDTKGRTLQAKFVRMEGGNVLLDIAGKVTPVPLGALSQASQQQARQLADLPPTSQPATGAPAISTADPAEAGFIPLLDFDQPGDWVQVGPGKMEIKNGVSTLSSPSKWGVAIYSKRTFADFILKAEFKGVSPLFNSGLWLRIPDLRNDIDRTVANRYEVGIVHSGGDRGRFTGSIWGVQPVRSDGLKANDWNELEVTVTGQLYVVKLNGKLVMNFNGSKGLSGYIGLEENGEPGGGPVQFRNVRVKPLP